MTVPPLAEQKHLATQRLEAAGLPVPELLAAARVGARLVAGAGASQLGGRPRMPAGWSWPEWNGRPLQYLARIDLEELSSVLSESDRHGLPATGQLHLMADPLGEAWGFDPADAGSFVATLVVEDRQAIVDYQTPTGIEVDGYPIELEVPVRFVSPVAELVPDDPEAEGMGRLLGNAVDDYREVRDQIDTELFGKNPRHRLFGRPDTVQGPMELECQLVSNGVYLGTSEAYKTPQASQLTPGASDWVLLAQLEYDDDLGWMWEDLGRIYWWLRRQDAAAGRPDRCWGILQSH